MTQTPPQAFLTVTSSGLKLRGEGPLEVRFTVDLVTKLFDLPTCPDPYTEAPRLLPSEILRRLSKTSHDSLMSVINTYPKLKATYAKLKANFAVYANPTTGKWPPLDGLLVLEAIPVDLPYILNLVWLLDGTIRITSLWDRETIIQTEDEFLSMHGKTFRAYCQSRIPLYVERYGRVLELIKHMTPTKAKVTYINRNSEVENKTVIFWQSDQIDQYLRRHELSHIATDPE